MSAVKESFVQELIGRYEGDRGMLIPMMQDLQAEYGYLPPEELRLLASELGVPLTRVYGVAMFYTSFRLSPRGQHEVTLCMGTVCYLKGAPHISEAICAEYGIQPGGTTSDRLFTLQAVNCVGACALAPVMVVDGKYYDGVTPDSALKVLRGLGEAAEAPAAEAGPEAPAARAPTPPVPPAAQAAAPPPPARRAAEVSPSTAKVESAPALEAPAAPPAGLRVKTRTSAPVKRAPAAKAAKPAAKAAKPKPKAAPAKRAPAAKPAAKKAKTAKPKPAAKKRSRP
jgi:NADH-quinone oxidoreductase subunit E